MLAVAVLAALGLVALLGYAAHLNTQLPDVYGIESPALALSSTAYTADGVLLARYHRFNRTWVGLDGIAPATVHALLATEDFRFYGHRGVDWRRFFGSILYTARGRTQGGSTISMQLARNLFPEQIGNDVSAARKIKEMLTARRLEQAYGKPQLLEMYLNTMPFGHNAFGIESAARVYFGKPARDLTVPEAALLVGMLKGTTRYDPFRKPDLALDRRALVLRRMVQHGYLDAAAAAAHAAEPLGVTRTAPDPAESPAPHFADYVAEWVQGWCAARSCDLYADGLKIYTTLDSRLQRLAETATAREGADLQAVADYEWSRAAPGTVASAAGARAGLRSAAPFDYYWRTRTRAVDGYVRATEAYRALRARGVAADGALARLRRDRAFMDSLRAVRTRLEVGLVAVEPGTGFVRAWVGGRSFAQDQYDHVAQAKRQPGSTFKAFVYTAAVDWGYRPGDRLPDVARTYDDGEGQRWTPTNSGGGASGALVTLRQGLVYSKNTISARIVHEVGPGYVARVARRMGIVSPLREVPSLALGTSEVTLLELTSAYGTLAAGGVRHVPIVVTRIEDKDGRVLADFSPTAERAIASSTAYTVVDMMRGVTSEGTGAAVRSRYGLRGDFAGKTGTTTQNADGWFVLMHPRLVVGAWVGFNDRRIAFRSSHWGQGGVGALSLVGDFMRRVQDDDSFALPDTERFQAPPGYDDLIQNAPSWHDAAAGLLLDSSATALPPDDAFRFDEGLWDAPSPPAERPTHPPGDPSGYDPFEPAVRPAPAPPVKEKRPPDAPTPAGPATPGRGGTTPPAELRRTGSQR